MMEAETNNHGRYIMDIAISPELNDYIRDTTTPLTYDRLTRRENVSENTVRSIVDSYEEFYGCSATIEDIADGEHVVRIRESNTRRLDILGRTYRFPIPEMCPMRCGSAAGISCPLGWVGGRGSKACRKYYFPDGCPLPIDDGRDGHRHEEVGKE